MITIPSGIEDPSYRYKMPKMELKQESRLNGVKTNIVNVDAVADALRVPSISIMKYLCSELGANMEQSSIIKGNHTYSSLLKHLDKFIGRYICCQGCNYPELGYFIEGKDLKSKCNSCGKQNSHDSMHKAGKALFSHVKAGKGQIVDITQKDKVRDNEDEDKGKKKKDKKKDKKKKKDQDSDEEEKEAGESENDEELTDLEEEVSIDSRRVAKIIGSIQKLSSAELTDNNKVFTMISEERERLNVPLEFCHYIALVGLFPPSRNIIKNWKSNENVFLNLVKDEGKIAKDHFLQALVLYFIRKYSSKMGKYAPTFMKLLVDENVINEKFLLDWFDKNVRLDKDSLMYDKKAEKKFRDLIEQFVEWLKNASSDDSSSSSGEDSGSEEKEDTEKAKREQEALERQKELIEK